MDYLKEFIATLQHLDHSRNNFEVFKDFLTLSTCAIAQPFYRSNEIEQQYLETVKRYNKEQAEQFSQLLALLISALSEQYQDFLGKVYMQLNLGNARTGQFFTPYHISQMMAEITFIDGKGAYTGEYKKILYCVITRLEMAKLKEIVHDIDPKAFIAITKAHEVEGGQVKKRRI